MFGSDIDFFGVYKRRRKFSMDFDKRKKIADAQAKVESLGKEFNVDTIFLNKNVLFEKLISRRIIDQRAGSDPLAEIEGISMQTDEDPVVSALRHLIISDRIGSVGSIAKTLTTSQRDKLTEVLKERRLLLGELNSLEQQVLEQEVDSGAEEFDSPSDPS